MTPAKHDLLANTTSVLISGDDNAADALTVDFSTGGKFTLPGGIQFTGGPEGSDSLTILTTDDSDTVVVTDSNVTINGSNIFYSNLASLSVDTRDGNDTITVKSLSTVPTSIDGGDPAGESPGDSFTGGFAGDFSGSLTLHGMEFVNLSIAGNLSGTIFRKTRQAPEPLTSSVLGAMSLRQVI